MFFRQNDQSSKLIFFTKTRAIVKILSFQRKYISKVLKKVCFFFRLTYSLLNRGPKCLQKFLLEKDQKRPNVFLRRICQKKRKKIFFPPIGRGHLVVTPLQTTFFIFILFRPTFFFKVLSWQKFLPEKLKFCLYFQRGF